VIVGGGSCQDELIRRAAELGLRERVRFLGFSRAIPDVLRCFDIFALPSLSEGFPNTLVEAMATGLPCVATNLACIPEIVEHGRHGLLVKPGDPEALASALRALVADPPLRRALGAAARARVEESFGLDVTTDRFASYVDSIRELAGRRCASTSGS
jgi:glycosyltransferase involved in cell wall biosynthesis